MLNSLIKINCQLLAEAHITTFIQIGNLRLLPPDISNPTYLKTKKWFLKSRNIIAVERQFLAEVVDKKIEKVFEGWENSDYYTRIRAYFKQYLLAWFNPFQTLGFTKKKR